MGIEKIGGPGSVLAIEPLQSADNRPRKKGEGDTPPEKAIEYAPEYELGPFSVFSHSAEGGKQYCICDPATKKPLSDSFPQRIQRGSDGRLYVEVEMPGFPATKVFINVREK